MNLKAEFPIADHFLPAIINGDESNLTDKEIEQLDDFLYPKYVGCYFVTEGESFFGRDSVTKLQADCYTLQAWELPTEIELGLVDLSFPEKKDIGFYFDKNGAIL